MPWFIIFAFFHHYASDVCILMFSFFSIFAFVLLNRLRAVLLILFAVLFSALFRLSRFWVARVSRDHLLMLEEQALRMSTWSRSLNKDWVNEQQHRMNVRGPVVGHPLVYFSPVTTLAPGPGQEFLRSLTGGLDWGRVGLDRTRRFFKLSRVESGRVALSLEAARPNLAREVWSDP